MTRWVREMPPEGRAELEPLRPLAEFFGYSIDGAELSPWSDPGAPYRNLMTGSDVAKRKEHRGIDWDEEVPRNFADRPLTHVELQRFVEEIRAETRAAIPKFLPRVAARVRRRFVTDRQ